MDKLIILTLTESGSTASCILIILTDPAPAV